MNFTSRLFGISLIVLSLSFSSCISVELEKAFEGKLEGDKNNEVIADYCITCHLHKGFDAQAHLFDVKYRYDDPKYAGKTDCNVCHKYEKTWLLDIRRKTHRPMADL